MRWRTASSARALEHRAGKNEKALCGIVLPDAGVTFAVGSRRAEVSDRQGISVVPTQPEAGCARDAAAPALRRSAHHGP